MNQFKSTYKMNQPLYDFFTKDHERIEKLLDNAVKNPDSIDMEFYNQFRIGLLTHIKMEEKILFPAAQKANGGEPVPMAAELRLEHGAITSLMVPPPTTELVKVIRALLEIHDLKEEEPGGMYEICEALTQSETESILKELHETTEVPVHPPNSKPIALEAAKRALIRAGYDYDVLANT